ncbi:hypothetical protein Cob_v010343 [Colletotrichum orbiculare MAFF 240422]|uniref:DUF8035 domain-containing protein n=3 Tax=Colletotrichum orbiculare species complex TaxID=2707354 RepID=N4VQK4_COLOR|nr:hypothetical protein Cob_v010343 [Colletotrichum orbiculare MAFF 240422]TDZ30421.1 hypothetical protein C8035_v002520 [Colletotrichum spinosum]TDZ60864.1 hypothetical protein CTRI78_v004595 [Colletotrichum trifolii]
MAGRGERWDRDRFMYERERDRGYADDRSRFEERSRIEERDDYYPPPRRVREHSDGPPRRTREHSDERYDRDDRSYRGYDDDYVKDRRYYEEDRHGPRRGEPFDREFDRRLNLERERERRSPSPVRRPTMLRRQSSLDTFDRRPARFWEREREEYPPPARREDIRRDDHRAPPYVPIPLPRTRQLGPAPSQRYDEIQIAEPGYYGDEEYRGMPERVKEREIVSSRRRRNRSRESRVSRSTKTHSHRSSSRSSSTSSRSTSTSGTTLRSEYPKKGKTRIPGRLVSKRALIDLGYPYIEEGNTVIVLKALGQANIDELLKLSEEYKQSELEVAAARSSAGRVEERYEEIYTIPPAVAALPPPPPPPPASVAPPPPPPVVVAPPPAPPTVVSVPAAAPVPVVVEAAPPPPPPPAPVEEVVERRTVIREVSPARSSTSYTTSTTATPTMYERREYSEEIPIGPMAVAERRRSRSRSRKNIRSEIKALEAELHGRRRHGSHSRDLVRAEQMPDGAVVLYEEKVEHVEEPRRGVRIEKDKKGPPPKLMRAMLATLT